MGMADRKIAVVAAMARAEVPQTVTELAETTGLAPSTTYAVMRALERQGTAEKRGVALNGGQTWDLPRDSQGAVL